jgi:hypothetical protein
MSVKETIQFFHQFNTEAYLILLQEEQGATEHPSEPDAYVVGNTPFYQPRQIEDHVSVFGFNYFPLSSALITVLATHPEIVPDEVLVCWTAEQDLIWKGTMGKVRKSLVAKKLNS